MADKDNNDLRRLEAVVEQLGYSVELLTKSEELPVEMLSIKLEEDGKNRPQFLTLTSYPLGDELDASNFIQFYFQYPFEISKAHSARILQAIPAVNQQLPLGHFNISADENSLYFKYVLALPKNQKVKPLFLNDVLDMCIYAQEHYLAKFEILA